MTVPMWVWIVSIALTLIVLSFDVWWAMRNPHVPSRKETTGFLTVYVSAAVLFGIGGTFVVGIGALLVGVVLMVIWYLFPRSKPFFQGRSLNRETPVMVPDEPGDIIRSIDGGI